MLGETFGLPADSWTSWTARQGLGIALELDLGGQPHMTALRQALWPQTYAPGGFLPHPTVHPEQISIHDSPPGTRHSLSRKTPVAPHCPLGPATI